MNVGCHVFNGDAAFKIQIFVHFFILFVFIIFMFLSFLGCIFFIFYMYIFLYPDISQHIDVCLVIIKFFV